MRKTFVLILSWISLNICVSITYGSVVINEIMYNPNQCDDSDCEWIELYNTADYPVNLTGWTIDGNPFGNENISAKGFMVVARELLDGADADMESFEALWGNNDTVWNSSDGNYMAVDGSFSLANSGDTINLTNGTYWDAIAYSSSWGANGDGYALERIDPNGVTNSSDNWKPSNIINGTPGYRNSVSPSDHDMAVYESDIIFDPVDPSPRTGVNISFLIRNTGLNDENNVNISVYNSTGSELGMIHSELLNATKQSSTNMTVKWNSTAKIASNVTVRIEGLSDDNATNDNASKGISFDFHLVVNEIMYNPPAEIGGDADFEWIEIYNNATYGENLTNWFLDCDGKSKSLDGILNSGGYLVLAKDTKQFYTYYSSSIKSDSQRCSLNNDGDTVKLAFNDSVVYHEEIVQYSNSWGADGTGYSLERISPSKGDWGESKVHGGTPGANNNPDNSIKNSMANPDPTIVYRTVKENVYVDDTGETADYQIISFPAEVHAEEPFKVIVGLKSPTAQNIKLYSYVYDGKKLVSEGFNGVNWKARWDANSRNVQAGPEQSNVELENKIKADTPPGKYKFRVRIRDEIDLTRDIEVLAKRLENADETAGNVSNGIIIRCERLEGIALVSLEGQSIEPISMMHFSNEPTGNKTIGAGNTTVALNEGYNFLLFVEKDRILKTCEYSFAEQSLITGRTVKINSMERIILKIKQWIKDLVS